MSDRSAPGQLHTFNRSKQQAEPDLSRRQKIAKIESLLRIRYNDDVSLQAVENRNDISLELGALEIARAFIQISSEEDRHRALEFTRKLAGVDEAPR